MSFFHIVKKQNRIYVWLAVDRNRNKILDFAVTETRDLQVYRRLALKIKKKFKINILCTDGNFTYKKIKISNKHVISKSETCLAESKNSIIRRRLARFHRKTSCYSKSIDMLSASLLLLFNEINYFIL